MVTGLGKNETIFTMITELDKDGNASLSAPRSNPTQSAGQLGFRSEKLDKVLCADEKTSESLSGMVQGYMYHIRCTVSHVMLNNLGLLTSWGGGHRRHPDFPRHLGKSSKSMIFH